jgi:L-amino acid N-acyltransferase YncA
MVDSEEATGKPVYLKDGTEVRVRPMRSDDVERSHAFFLGLSDEDRKYLRTDVTRREVVERRIRKMDSGFVKRLVALEKDEIVADGALEVVGDRAAGTDRELRLIVSRSHRRQGLGVLMARELYTLAAADGVKQIVVRMMRPQLAAQHIFHRLGFREVETLPKEARDQTGASQDVIVMRCDMEAMWERIASFFAASDWQRAR